jgi:chromate transporter
LFLGAIGFGGGVSVLASIRNLVVERHRWLSEKEFDNTATVAQMLPGGAAANALASVGLRFHGVKGAAVSYLGFVIPGALSILLLAFIYVRFGAVPHADAFLAGLNAAVVGIIIAITVKMSRTSVARPWQMGVVAGALLLGMVGGASSLEVAFLGIATGLAWELGLARARLFKTRKTSDKPAPPVALPEDGKPMPRAAASAAPPPAHPAEVKEPPNGVEGTEEARESKEEKKKGRGFTTFSISLLGIFGLQAPQLLADLLPLMVVFFRTGLGAYGGGFAIIPALHSEVFAHGWLSERQFADAVAVGKLTPGPVLLMATFIGYLRDGFPGAFAATLAILAAPFMLVVLFSAWLDRVRSKRWMRAALRGLTPAVVGLMIAAALTLGQSMHAASGVAIAAAVAVTLIRFETINPVLMLALGGVTRLVLGFLESL